MGNVTFKCTNCSRDTSGNELCIDCDYAFENGKVAGLEEHREKLSRWLLPESLWLAEMVYQYGPQCIQLDTTFTNARRLVEAGHGEWRVEGELLLVALTDKGAVEVARRRETSKDPRP